MYHLYKLDTILLHWDEKVTQPIQGESKAAARLYVAIQFKDYLRHHVVIAVS